MCVKFKDDIKKLPRNRSKYQQYRDLDFHEQIKLNVNEKDRISTKTVNNYLGYVSSFMRWSVINGFVDVNFFEGMKLKIQVHNKMKGIVSKTKNLNRYSINKTTSNSQKSKIRNIQITGLR